MRAISASGSRPARRVAVAVMSFWIEAGSRCWSKAGRAAFREGRGIAERDAHRAGRGVEQDDGAAAAGEGFGGGPAQGEVDREPRAGGRAGPQLPQGQRRHPFLRHAVRGLELPGAVHAAEEAPRAIAHDDGRPARSQGEHLRHLAAQARGRKTSGCASTRARASSSRPQLDQGRGLIGEAGRESPPSAASRPSAIAAS